MPVGLRPSTKEQSPPNSPPKKEQSSPAQGAASAQVEVAVRKRMVGRLILLLAAALAIQVQLFIMFKI